jgi:hypothetical protein
MPDAQIPDRPNLEQYKKQAKELARDCAQRNPAALERIHRHPRFRQLTPDQIPDQLPTIALADAQLVLAREHGFPSWPKFAAHLETLRIIRSVEEIRDPINTFIEVACVPRHGWHASGSLEHAQLILARYPQVATANIYTAAVLADEPTLRSFLARDSNLATATGGPHQCDALTYLALYPLCKWFSDLKRRRTDPWLSYLSITTARRIAFNSVPSDQSPADTLTP